jgi:hypothetical protein
MGAFIYIAFAFKENADIFHVNSASVYTYSKISRLFVQTVTQGRTIAILRSYTLYKIVPSVISFSSCFVNS